VGAGMGACFARSISRRRCSTNAVTESSSLIRAARTRHRVRSGGGVAMRAGDIIPIAVAASADGDLKPTAAAAACSTSSTLCPHFTPLGCAPCGSLPLPPPPAGASLRAGLTDGRAT